MDLSLGTKEMIQVRGIQRDVRKEISKTDGFCTDPSYIQTRGGKRVDEFLKV